MLKNLFFIMAGGGLGAVLRYGVCLLAAAVFGRSFPLGTLAVNAVGSFFIGFLALRTQNFGEHWRLFLIAGLLGGFTTFSAFSHETMTMFNNKQAAYALLNIFLNIALCLLLVFAGYKAALAMTD
ncbi:MAG: fluoride efflux transporter CrcB [Elusimicrobiota bacterium]|jgi:CrcB protein|nr:fluoride efflux transporter CrcB [Elusimicrobiota bacterium]